MEATLILPDLGALDRAAATLVDQAADASHERALNKGLWNLQSGELLRTLRRDRPYERLNITGIRGLSDAQKVSLHALGAFEVPSGGG